MSSESAPHQVTGDAAGRGKRPPQPEPFLRGVAWPGTRSVPYPRAAPLDRMRLPGDTWQMASIPVGARFEVTGDATALRISYEATTDELGYRGSGAGVAFEVYVDDERVGEAPAALGQHACEVPLRPGARNVVYLPEGMRPVVTALEGVGGQIEPAPAQPRWIVYGDSVAEGWIASRPALAWPAVAGRQQDLDHVNLGYAGAARGETASAEQVAALEADVFTVCHGTNCWTRTPHSVEQMHANLDVFLTILRQEHPDVPIVVASPVIRPDAEDTPNRLGATLADLRAAMEAHVEQRVGAGDARLTLVRGLDLLGAEHLGDGIHPDDEGHRRMAQAIGTVVRVAREG